MTVSRRLDYYEYFVEPSARKLKQKSSALKSVIQLRHREIKSLRWQIAQLDLKVHCSSKLGLLANADRQTQAASALTRRIAELERLIKPYKSELSVVTWALMLRNPAEFRAGVSKLQKSYEGLGEKLKTITDLEQSIRGARAYGTADAAEASLSAGGAKKNQFEDSSFAFTGMVPPRIVSRMLRSEIEGLEKLAYELLSIHLQELQSLTELACRREICNERLSESLELAVSADEMKAVLAQIRGATQAIQSTIWSIPALKLSAADAISSHYSAVLDHVSNVVSKKEVANRLDRSKVSLEPLVKNISKKTESLSKQVVVVNAATAELTDQLKQDRHVSREDKCRRRLKDALHRLTDLAEDLRREIHLHLEKPELRCLPIAIAAEDAVLLGCRCVLNAHMVIQPSLQSETSIVIDSLRIRRMEGLENTSGDLSKEYESLMMELLSCLDNVLAHEVGLRQDLRRRKTSAACASETIVSDGSGGVDAKQLIATMYEQVQTSDNLLKECAEIAAKYKISKSDISDQLRQSGIIDYRTPFDRSLRKSKEKLSTDLKADPRKEINPGTFVATIEEPLTRIVNFLDDLDRSFLVEEGTTEKSISPSGSWRDDQNCTEAEAVLQRSRQYPKLNRDAMRLRLSEMLDAERELRELTTSLLVEEEAKSELWLRRTLVAKKVGDHELAKAAEERRGIHDEIIALLVTLIDGSASKDVHLPDSFIEARKVLERMEAKLGLTPNKVLFESNLVVALCLFDRIVLLVENLNKFIENDAITSKA